MEELEITLELESSNEIPITLETENIIINYDVELQEKTIIPTKEKQSVKPDIEYDALSEVIVKPIPNEYIIPNGNLDIKINGNYDVTEKVSVNVNVDPNLQDKQVNIKPLENKSITADEGYDGLGVVNVIGAVDTENIEVTPTKETQTINRSENKYIESVKINPIPNEYIVPSGELEITENGQHNVTDKESVNVDIQPNLGTKTITENGVYNAIDDNLDGYSQISVETSGANINEYFKTTYDGGISGQSRWVRDKCILKIPDVIIPDDYTGVLDYFCADVGCVPKIIGGRRSSSATGMYSGCTATEIDTSGLVLSSVKQANSMFTNNQNLIKIDLSKANMKVITGANSMLYRCPSLKTADLSGCDFSYIQANMTMTGISSMLSNCTNLENLIFGTNLGKGYTASANNNNAKLDLSTCTLLTVDSLLDVINKLYDLAGNGKATQQLILGATNLAKLSEEQIAIATNKGWNVS